MRVLVVLGAIVAAVWRIMTAPMVYLSDGGGKFACESLRTNLQAACVSDNETVILHLAVIAVAALALFVALGPRKKTLTQTTSAD